MYHSKDHHVYIMTNKNRTVLYIGMTSSLNERVRKHYNSEFRGFSKRYNCQYLIYFEKFEYVGDAIKRKKQLKGWRREKKLNLIKSQNPDLTFLNNALQGL